MTQYDSRSVAAGLSPAATQTHWHKRWFHWLGGAPYDIIFEREWLGRPAGRLLWGWDVSLLYKSMAVIGEVAEGGTILDVPCGGGIALRGLQPGQRVRYVAADISVGMLERARRAARRRNLQQVDFIEGNVQKLPFEDGSFDLCLCFNGLDCFSDPQGALKEFVRCLVPGGRLVGDAVVFGGGARFDKQIRLYQRRRVFGRVATPAELDRWFADVGLVDAHFEQSGAVVHFAARHP